MNFSFICGISDSLVLILLRIRCGGPRNCLTVFLDLLVRSVAIMYNATTTSGSPGQPEIVINKVLCFIQQKCNILPIDDIVKICCDYYSVDDIEKARSTLSSYVDKNVYRNRKGWTKMLKADQYQKNEIVFIT